jgi:hypothetical protein
MRERGRGQLEKSFTNCHSEARPYARGIRCSLPTENRFLADKAGLEFLTTEAPSYKENQITQKQIRTSNRWDF